MICQQCGTEIADKALICYKCGASTEDPVQVSATRARARKGRLDISLVAILILVLAGVFMGGISTGDVPRWASWTLAALGAVLLIWRLARRGVK